MGRCVSKQPLRYAVSAEISSIDFLKRLANSTDYPLLTADEERGSALQARAGDQEARDRLILCNVRLAIRIASRYFGVLQGYADDIISLAIIGLIKAVDKYNPDCGRFSTY